LWSDGERENESRFRMLWHRNEVGVRHSVEVGVRHSVEVGDRHSVEVGVRHSVEAGDRHSLIVCIFCRAYAE